MAEGPSLGEIQLNENASALDYDLAISERYQAFSGELLRLSLLLLGAIAFLVEHLGLPKWAPGAKLFVTGTLVFASLSAGAALAHRYVGSDSLAYHLAYLRLVKRGGRADASAAATEKEARDLRLRLAGQLLFWSALFLGLGALGITLAFTIHLWQP